jgi:L-ascorbate metabolism protein UlaG (beta-lactamase superfamily)
MASHIQIDTSRALFEIGGVRLLTDRVFDPPGARYHFGWGALSRKSSTPALSPDPVGSIDAILLSHDQPGDNLDRAGREARRNGSAFNLDDGVPVKKCDHS